MNKRAINPFYVLSVVAGVLFAITACAYSLMMLVAIRNGALPPAGESGHELMAYLNRHGVTLMAAEVAALAVLTVSAIGLDHVRLRQSDVRPDDTAA